MKKSIFFSFQIERKEREAVKKERKKERKKEEK